METQRLLNKIESKEIVLPEFQREFTWKRSQSRALIDSLLKGYPTGSLLLWKTADVPALKNMPNFRPNGRVEVLLDGQQRLTALYMLIKDEIPPFYSAEDISSRKDPRKLHFNLETRKLGYYKKMQMKDDPRWVRIADCFRQDEVDPQAVTRDITDDEDERFETFGVLSKSYELLRGILEVGHPIMHVEDDASLRHALVVFKRVNDNGTELSKADIALAQMCGAWSETRRVFKEKLSELSDHGFEFDLTFLIRGMNAVVNGRAEFKALADVEQEELVAGWQALDKLLDYLVNFLKDHAHIHGTDDLNTPYVLIPPIGYLAQSGLSFQNGQEHRKLLYWIYAAHYQRRYSGSVDQKLERDLSALSSERPIEKLIAVLREDEGAPTVHADNMARRGVGHPFYKMTKVLIRADGGVDWSNGIGTAKPVGPDFSIERHHIFPTSVLKKAGYDTGSSLAHRQLVNELANRVPLTRAANMDIFTKEPSEYLPLVRENNPGNLERFMIPMDESLWDVERYEAFLQRRRQHIADRINSYMRELREGMQTSAQPDQKQTPASTLIRNGESERVEYKSTLRWHRYAERMDKKIEHASLKTIAAFLNSEGGTLLIGVNDDGEAIGLEYDQFSNDDKMMLHLTNIIKDRIGTSHMRFLTLSVEPVNGTKVLRVDCRPGITPAYLEHQNDEHFYVRTGPATSHLSASEIHDYVQERFHTN
jgi:hypothetical protein